MTKVKEIVLEDEVEEATALVPSQGFMGIIEKMAQVPTSDKVDSLERMMKMQMEWEDREEQKEFNAAIARIHAQLANVRIVKSKSVSYKGEKAFNYAPIEDIDKIVRPLLNEECISPSYTTEHIGNNLYNVTCRLTRGRQTTEASIPLPIDTSGGKNNVQGMGSTFAYGKRYALCAVLNILTVDEDNDGQGAPITDEQAKEIKQGFKDTGMDVAEVLKNLKVDCVENIPTKQYMRVKNLIQSKKYEMIQEKKEGQNEKPVS